MIQLDISTPSRTVLVDITDKVQRAVQEAGVKAGVCHLYVPHTTAGLIVNENADPSVAQDILDRLAQIAPREARYRHTEGNADAHIKSALVGTNASVLVENGRLALGTWQGIFFCEFDGPRRRKVWVKVVS